MENASKALIIAGGVLLAMMILALIIYAATAMGAMADSQDRRLATQQLQEFNESYLAYNKTRMYGTDVITVVNKAIDYNKRLGTDEEKYKINIVLKLNQNFDRTKEVIIQYGNGEKKYGTPQTIVSGTLKTGTYQLFEGSTKMNNDVLNFFAQNSQDEITETNRGTIIETTFIYSAITNFKTAIFKCEDVGYSEITGRVNSMTFTQI